MCPLEIEQINKSQYIQTNGKFPAVKMDELQLYTTTCMNFTNTPLNEISQVQKDAYLYDFIYIKFKTRETKLQC